MLCVIGCGNAVRSDDGVGVYVAQALRAELEQHPRPEVRVFDAGTGGMDVMFQARGARRLIIVDAATSGSEPGAIFKVPGRELESTPDLGFSLHDFRWQHALTAGRKIFGDEFPQDVTVYLIEAQNLGFGLELSPPVSSSAARVLEQIRALIVEYEPEGATRRTAGEASATDATAVSVAKGNFYLSRELCDAWLSGVASVALLMQGEDVMIVPLIRDSAGGLLLKQRNARGDRVIHAQEFFRHCNLPEDAEPRTLRAHWSCDRAALVVRLADAASSGNCGTA
jgi:hydrogenase maturation protease